MTPDAVLSSDAQPTPAALPLQAEVEVGIAQIETELASIAAEDTRPWVLDHSDDEWHSSGAVGSSAFARRAHRSPLLTADDECALARRIEAAAFAQERLTAGNELKGTERRGLEHVIREGEEAGEQMTLANVRLVTSIARKSLRRAGHGLQFDDLQQAGLVGLMRAVDGFDHTLGHKFSTYATWWIRQSISRTIDDEARVIRVPVHALEKARVVDAARRSENLTWEHALADPGRLGVTAEDVGRARAHLRPCLSLDDVVSHVEIEDDLDPIAQLDERVSHAADIADFLESLIELPGLGSRAVTVLEMRFGLTGQDPMTLDEIGKHFSVTRERIRQIEKKSLVALRERAEQDHGETHR